VIPLRLTDRQVTLIMDAVRHWPPQSRSAFLRRVAARLAGVEDPGDGEVNAAVRSVASEMAGQRARWLS
jgi:hypothetical protein